MCPTASTRTLCPGSERLSLRLPRAPRRRRTFWGGQVDGPRSQSRRQRGGRGCTRASRPEGLTSVIYRAVCQLWTLGRQLGGPAGFPIGMSPPMCPSTDPAPEWDSRSRTPPPHQPNHSQALKMAVWTLINPVLINPVFLLQPFSKQNDLFWMFS